MACIDSVFEFMHLNNVIRYLSVMENYGRPFQIYVRGNLKAFVSHINELIGLRYEFVGHQWKLIGEKN